MAQYYAYLDFLMYPALHPHGKGPYIAYKPVEQGKHSNKFRNVSIILQDSILAIENPSSLTFD